MPVNQSFNSLVLRLCLVPDNFIENVSERKYKEKVQENKAKIKAYCFYLQPNTA